MPGGTADAPNPAGERRWLLIYLLIVILTLLVYTGLWAFSEYFSVAPRSGLIWTWPKRAQEALCI
jgi:hypothetical protein